MDKPTAILFSGLVIPDRVGNAPIASTHLNALNLELASLGYSMTPSLRKAMRDLSPEDFAERRKSVLDTLVEVTGASARHATLFSRFPHAGPRGHEFLTNWVLAAVQQSSGLAGDRLSIHGDGMVYDVTLAGVDGALIGDVLHALELGPTRDGLRDHDEVRAAFKRMTPLKPLFPMDRDALASAAATLILRPSSLSKDERAFVSACIPIVGRQALAAGMSGGKIYRENLPLAYVVLDDDAIIAEQLSGATDVLRIAAYLSNAEADLSLKEAVRFKIATRHKKRLLGLLEGLPKLGEDLMRHRERWLRFGEIVNPGTEANRVRFPRTHAAFASLRNDAASISTFNRLVERKVRAREIDGELLETLVRRPGEFMRRLDLMLRSATNPTMVLAALPEVARGAATPLLFALSKYLRHRASAAGRDRVFLPKGQVNKMQIVPDRRPGIDDTLLEAAAAHLDVELQARLSKLEPLGKVWLDPALKGVVIPYNRRGDSSTNAAMSKGSSYPMGRGAVVRLFIHWTGQDVDLSVLMLNEDLENVGEVSWQNSEQFSCIHSGDVRSAPSGASEFIDFGVADLLKQGVRYVVASVISYAGGTFDGFPCFGGFMERDAMKSGRKFEPSAVRLKFDLSMKSTSALPMIFDLVERRVVYADLASGGRSYGTARGSADKLTAQLRAILDMPSAKPTAWDVLEAHVNARGQLVMEPGEAERSFQVEGLDLEEVARLAAA